jgi:hypothetical protein
MRSLILFTVLASLSCVPEFDDNLSTVSSPRLLAIQSEPAEAEPGDEVRLRALVAAADGSVVDEPRFSLCVDRKPLSELGPVNPSCLASSGEGIEVLGRGLALTATLPDDGCRLFGPIAPPPKGNEPPSRPVDPDPTGGFYQPVIASLEGVYSLGSVRLDCGIQRAAREQLLSYNAQYRKNENPRVAALELADDGTAVEPGSTPTLSVAPGAAVSLTASWDACPTEPVCGDGICGAYEDRANCEVDCAVEAPKGCTGAEPYVWYDLETFTVEPRHEGIRVAWYASAGSFEDEQTGRDEGDPGLTVSNVWLTPARSGVVTLWLVIRDSRGGVSWETYRVEVRE